MKRRCFPSLNFYDTTLPSFFKRTNTYITRLYQISKQASKETEIYKWESLKCNGNYYHNASAVCYLATKKKVRVSYFRAWQEEVKEKINNFIQLNEA